MIEYGNPQKGMIKDFDESNLGPDQYSFALNAYDESNIGNGYILQNGPSNLLGLIFEEGENVLGKKYIIELNSVLLFTTKNRILSVPLKDYDDKDLNFKSGDDNIESIPLEKINQTPFLSSEILVESSCFNWDIRNKLDIAYSITESTLNLYIVDGFNEDKYIYFDIDFNTKSLTVNETFLTNGQIDCNKIKWNPEVSYPKITTKIVDGGKLKAGVYQPLVAFATSKGVELSPYKAITNPIHIFTKQLTQETDYETNEAIEITVDEIFTNGRYEFINIAVLETINGISTYYLVTTLPINQKLQYLYTGEGIKTRLDESTVFALWPYYKSSRYIEKGGGKLFKARLKEYEKFNLQPIAERIKLKWFTIVASEGEYVKPEFAQNYRTYPRDEVFGFAFNLILDNGEETQVFHIPGNKPTDEDLQMICRTVEGETNYDMIIPIDECDPEECQERWKIYNTAKETRFYSDELKNCEYPIHTEGDFSYWRSTEKYPNEPEVWGGLAGQEIRLHKFPDCLVSPIHDGNDNMFISYNGSNKIYPIGIKLDDGISMEQLLKDAVSYGYITEEQRLRVRGYKIFRTNRFNHKSVIAKGLLYDVWSYNVKNGKRYYANYPFNDLRNDNFISGDYIPETENSPVRARNNFIYSNKYTFHSPDTHFVQPTIPNILKIENESYGEAEGFFSKSKGQAQYALLDRGWYNLAIILGVHVARGLSAGESSNQADTGQQIGALAGGVIGSIIPGVGTILGAGIGTLAGRLIGGMIKDEEYLKALQHSLAAISQAEKFLQLFQNIVKTKNYHYQYQAVGKYSNTHPVPNNGNKQRTIVQSDYLEPQRQTIGSIFFNNYGRESSVFLEIDHLLPETIKKDHSRFIMSQNPDHSPGNCEREEELIRSNISSYYASLKRNIVNQYGNVFDFQYIPLSNRTWKLNENFQEFGGDTYIGRFALKRKHQFFTNTSFNLPDYTDIYYEQLGNVGHPRYFFNTKYTPDEGFNPIVADWFSPTETLVSGMYALLITAFRANKDGYDMLRTDIPNMENRFDSPEEQVNAVYNNLFGISGYNGTGEMLKLIGRFFKGILLNPFRLLKPPHMNLDCLDSKTPIFTQTRRGPASFYNTFKWQMGSLDGKIYTYSYGIPYFICESDVNLDLRYAKDNNENDFYPRQKDLTYWLQQENVSPMIDNQYYYNRTYSKQNTEAVVVKQDPNFLRSKERIFHRNSVIASQRSSNIDTVDFKDPYLYFKPLDFYRFSYEDGLLTGLDILENEKMLVRFENNSKVFNTFDTMTTGNGNVVELGSLGTFGRPQDFSKTKLGFFASQHTNMLSTEYGHIIVDALRGQVFKLGVNASGIDILSNKGYKNWFKENLPFKIIKYFPDVDIDNEYNNIGILLSFNKRYDCFHLTKRDYVPLVNGIIHRDGKFFLDDVEISIRDKKYFCDASWTISYNFLKESWRSFHSFTPNYYIDLINSFYAGLNGFNEGRSTLWGHNLTNKSFQVYFGNLYPFIVEGRTKPSINHDTLMSVSFLLTVKRNHNYYDEYIKNEVSFNKAIVYNEHQNSGLLELELLDPKDPMKLISYPKMNQNSITIGMECKEDLYSFNQFFDISKSSLPRFLYDCSSVYQRLNPDALDYKISHINNNYISDNINYIRLINDKWSNYKMIFKGFLTDEKPSVR